MLTAPRIRIGLLLLALAVLALLPGVGHAATFAWSPPTPVQAGHGDTFLGTLACPSTTECTAAGENLGASYDGYVVDFNPLSSGTVTPYEMATDGVEPRFEDVSCPSTSQCTAVAGDGKEWTYDPASPSGATSYAGYAGFVSCPTTTECAAMQQGDYGAGNPDPHPNGTVVVSAFNPQAPAAHTDTIIGAGTQGSQPNSPGNVIYALACATTTQCTLVASNNTDGVAYTFDPLVPSTPSPAVVDPGLTGMSNAHLSCPTAAECVLVDRSGHEVTFDPAAPWTPNPVDIDPTAAYMADVTCPSAAQCTAIDDKARAVTFDPANPTSQSLTPVANSDDLTSIACPSTAECVTIGGGGTGNLYVGRLVNGTPTGTPVLAKPKVKGTAAAVQITCKGVNGLACPVKLSLTTKIKHRTKTLGTTSRKIAAGRKATVKVRLSRAGTKLLAQRKRLSLRLSMAQRGQKTVTKTVTFKK